MRTEHNVVGEPATTPYGDTVAGMRAVIGRHLRGGRPDKELRESLGPVVRAARARGLQPEQLIIATKTVWFSLPEARDQSVDSAARNRQIERIISTCIDEYDSK